MSFLDKFKNKTDKDAYSYLKGFSKTSSLFSRKLRFITSEGDYNSEDFLEKLMVTLIECDLGYPTASKITDAFYKAASYRQELDEEALMEILSQIMINIYNENPDGEIISNPEGVTVDLLIGVNGSGKTSSISKLANLYLKEGKKIALVAADTFRAGAVEQLKKWAETLNIPCISGKENQDPSSVLVEGCRYAMNNDIDILLCDTAGRLQNKVNLMAELAKMKRVVGKEIPGAPHNTWLVLDANTGQNGLSQAALFNESSELNGVILSKMDGTSKGGIVIAIKNELHIPVRYIAFGETLEDIKPFDLELFVYGIIGGLNED